MSSKDRTTENLPLECQDCAESIIKTASGTFVCTGCGKRSQARAIK